MPAKTHAGLALATLAALAFAAGWPAQASSNIVLNPTFSNDPSGIPVDWTVADPSNDFYAYTSGGYQSGGRAVFAITSAAQPITLSQTLSGTANENYLISYYLLNNGGPDNEFQVSFDGAVVSPLTVTNADAYTSYDYFSATATASTANAALQFSEYRNSSSFELSDVSVTDAGPAASPAPEPSEVGVLALMGLGLGGLMLRARRSVSP